MTVPYTTDADGLAEAMTAALAATGYAEIVGLPPIPGCAPPLEQIVVLSVDGRLEAHIPSAVTYSGGDDLLARACDGPELPGRARLLTVVESGPAGLAADIVDLVGAAIPARPGPPTGWRPIRAAPPGGGSPGLPVESPGRPTRSAEELTDLDDLRSDEESVGVAPAALAAELALTVKGQAEAIRVISDAIAPAISRSAPRRPASVLLVGPTGVGKTATAEALAVALHDLTPESQTWTSVRVDLNQAAEAHSVSDLLGAPAGYVGHGDGSPLAEALAAHPRVVVVFDEVDKAHPDVMTVLMGAMDRGRIQLRRPIGGRWEVDCRQAVFVFTSNRGSERLADLSPAVAGAHLEEIARQMLIADGMPEWLAGRHGRIAVFRPLSTRVIAEVATLEVARLAEEFGLDLAWIEPSVVEQVLAEAGPTTTGARSLRLAADRLLAGDLAAARVDRVGDDGPVVVAGSPLRVVPLEAWEAGEAADR
ncbi:MAG TPA: AAA family ATPase [Iamia sp.]|nr:AAA family ATPase [Iamia sp.]